jgi:hypothetical protein
MEEGKRKNGVLNGAFEASRRQPLLPFCAAAAAAALLLPCPWDETGGELGGKLETQNE